MPTSVENGWDTMTTESSKNGATILSRMNFSGYVRHVTIQWISCYCVLFSSVVAVRIRMTFHV